MVTRERLRLQRSFRGVGASEILRVRYASVGEIDPEHERPNTTDDCKMEKVKY